MLKYITPPALSLAIIAGATTHAAQYELAPNPNPGQNVITVASNDLAINTAEPFTNWGGIIVQGNATLRNVTEMDIVFDEDKSGGLSYMTIQLGATLEILKKSKMNFDTASHFSVQGIVNNRGKIGSSSSIQLGQTSLFNNFGTLRNKRGATLRGQFENHGTLVNATAVSSAGGFFQQIGQLVNHTQATITNQGYFLNFRTITNRGKITNSVIGSSGRGRGFFRNMGTIDNQATGEITNRQRWFNTGTLNNAGYFLNHAAGLGLSNDRGEIHNLAGGTFQNDKALNSNSLITNAGTFIITGRKLPGFGLNSTAPYTQTNGKTILEGTLKASIITIKKGILSGAGQIQGPTHIEQNAILEIGQDIASLAFSENLTLQGNLKMDIEQQEVTDDITISQTLTLGQNSILTINFPTEFTPTISQTFDIIQTQKIKGQFSKIQVNTPLDGVFQPIYLVDQIDQMDQIRLIYQPDILTGDLTGDRVVDEADLQTVKNAIGSIYSLSDLFDVRNFFNQSPNSISPQETTHTNIPEPTTLAIISLLNATLLLKRKKR